MLDLRRIDGAQRRLLQMRELRRNYRLLDGRPPRLPNDSQKKSHGWRAPFSRSGGISMGNEELNPVSFVDMVLILLESRFPWLGNPS